MIDDLVVAKKLLNLQESAEKRGKEFTLTFGQVKKLMTVIKCHYTGVVLERNDYPTTKDNQYYNPNGRSVDRLDNTKGYIKGNVVACTMAFNKFKSNLGVKEFNSMLLRATSKFKKELQCQAA